MDMEDSGTPGGGFVKRLGALDTALLVIGAVVGSGIFLTSGLIAADLPSPGGMLLAWLVGGLVAIAGALTFAELGVLFPRAGGPYVYLREAFGRGAGFVFGWGFFWFIMCGGIAALAAGFAEFLGSFVPALSTKTVLLSFGLAGRTFALTAGQIVAAAVLIALTGLNSLGIRTGTAVQNILTVLRLGVLAALIVAGFCAAGRAGSGSAFELFPPGAPSGVEFLKAFGLALVAVFWTYDGWYAANCTAEEIRRPERDLPVGLILGTLTVTVLYLLVNIIYLKVLSVPEMAGVTKVGELAASRLMGPGAAAWFSAAIMVSIFGCLHATIIYGPRVFYAMARDGAFFRGMGTLHPRTRVPVRALAGQGAWAAVLCLTGTYRALYEYVIFALLLFFAAGGVAVLVLRKRRPDLPRPYRTWGYPVVPLLFSAIAFGVFINTVVSAPGQSFVGLVLLAAGFPAYAFWRRKERAAGRVGGIPSGARDGIK